MAQTWPRFPSLEIHHFIPTVLGEKGRQAKKIQKQPFFPNFLKGEPVFLTGLTVGPAGKQHS